MIIDVAECTNCNLCTLAMMDEYVDNEFPGYSAPMPKHGHKWIDILQNERGQGKQLDIAYARSMCNHCDDAPCIAAAKDGAVTKSPDGIVMIDPVKSKGQKQIVDACAYGHVWWNDELKIPQAWNFDAHLLDAGWKQTRGGQVCPTGAMKAVKLEDDDMLRVAVDEELDRMKPELGTRPRVWYRNLWRYSTAFVAGSAAQRIANVG
jgi:Fe-S-cluster-containing dehydrogenase component